MVVIILATAFGMCVGALGGFLMHQDFRSEIGIDGRRAVVAGIVLGGLTGLLGSVPLAL
jgi:hypothetical protein